jgi:hypothetical protein
VEPFDGLSAFVARLAGEPRLALLTERGTPPRLQGMPNLAGVIANVTSETTKAARPSG